MNKQLKTVLTIQAKDQPALFPKVASALGENKVNILGHKGHTENGSNSLSLLVDNPKKASSALEEQGLRVQKEEWVTAEVENTTGSAAKLTRPLKDQDVQVRSSFPFVEEDKQGLAIQTRNPKETLEKIGKKNK